MSRPNLQATSILALSITDLKEPETSCQRLPFKPRATQGQVRYTNFLGLTPLLTPLRLW